MPHPVVHSSTALLLCTYVRQSQRNNITHSAHSSVSTGHPGANRTLSLLQKRFWWPNMARDVRRFVQGCPDCTISKSPRHLPSGKLLPLPVPRHPWSHLGVDFATDLPPSEGNTCILVVVERFSKSCRLIPLKGLPTATSTAELLFNHVFRHWDSRGHRIRSGASVHLPGLGVLFQTPRCDSLSSGYHPQTNGQTERKEIGRFLRTFSHGRQNS